MIREFKPAGTLLFGRAMAAQLLSEMVHLGVEKPVIVAQNGFWGKARKAGRMLSAGVFKSIKIVDESVDPGEADFLILAGGRSLTDHFQYDKRFRAHFPLNVAHLEEIAEPSAHFLVVDSAFIPVKAIPTSFYQNYARSISGGYVKSSTEDGKSAIEKSGPVKPGSFTFQGRTAVFSGDNGLDKLPEILKENGTKKPLVLTDKGIISVGLLDFVQDQLEGENPVVFSDIPPDSRIDVVNSISDLYRKEQCDAVIAFGGGSVLDTGKGVYLNVSLGVEDLNSMVGSGRIPRLTVPFIAIPTTSGTGSEMTNAAVVSDPEKGRKLLFISDNLQPDYAILDSRLTASLPPFLTSITGMDAMTHAVEAFTCLGKNPMSDRLAWAAIELIRDHLPGAIEEPGNLDHRRALAVASNMAGSAFSNSMVGMVHTVGHSIGAVCHAPHGSCMSVLLPHVLKYNFKAIESILAQLLCAVAGPKVYDETPADLRAEKTIEEIGKLNSRLREITGERHPVSLSQIVDREGNPLVREEHFQQIAETSMGDASIVYNPVELRKDDVLNLLKEAI